MLYRRDSITYRLLDAFFRNWGIFLLCVVGISSIVSVALITRSQSYVASVSIRVVGDTELNKAIGMMQYRSWESPAKRNIARFSDMMQDMRPTGFVNTTLQTANLSKPIKIDGATPDPRLGDFQRGIFTAAKSKELFSIGLIWDDKQECEKLVEAIQKRFIETIGEMSQADGIATVQFMDGQLADYRKRLQSAEKALSDFQIQMKGSLPGSQPAEIQRLVTLKTQRDALVTTSQDSALTRKAIEDRLKEIKPETVLAKEVSTDPLLLSIRELQAKRTALIKDNWKPDSQMVQVVDLQIDALKKDLERQQKSDPNQARNVDKLTLQDNPERQELQQQLVKINIAERTQKAQLAKLDQQIGEFERRIQLLPAAERILAEKTRDREFIQTQYQNLWARREQARLKASVDKINETSKLSPQSIIRAEPTLGKSKKVALIGGSVLLGLVVGCLMILLREWMDASLRYASDTERLLGVPVLASLPASPVLQFPLSTSRPGRLRPRSNGRPGSLPAISAPPGTE